MINGAVVTASGNKVCDFITDTVKQTKIGANRANVILCSETESSMRLEFTVSKMKGVEGKLGYRIFGAGGKLENVEDGKVILFVKEK